MESRALDAVVVSTPVNIFYLTGFQGSAGVTVLSLKDALLWVDPRYTLQAREEAQGMEVIEARGSLLEAAAKRLGRSGHKRIGFEDTHLTYAAFRHLAHLLPRGVRLRPAGGVVEELRYVKDEEEIDRIREAGRLTAAVFDEVVRGARPGVRESDLAAEIEYRMKLRGAEGPAFETIVASGPRSAMPHARASSKLLRERELVIFDLGAILRGYAADMTRTVFLGQPSRRVQRLYAAVREAQQQASRVVRPGVRAGEVDASARRVLARKGLARYFTHSTGHGVGLEIHERPRLARGEKPNLEVGCVITVEPGVYVEDLGGIRIEDTILVGADGPQVLTPAPKDVWCI